MKSKILLLAFTLLLLMGIPVSAVEVTTIDLGHSPAIYENKVVWSDDTNNSTIHVYDLTTKKDTEISSYKAAYPAIYGNILVWHDKSSETPKLTIYDISSGARSYLTENIDDNSIPAIHGNRIVWGANNSVYMRDISAHTLTMIAYGKNPDIYDTKITYISDTNTPSEVYVYDITSGKTVNVGSGNVVHPHIYGNRVVWADQSIKLGNILMYDLDTQKLTEITTGGSYENGTEYGYNTGGVNDIFNNKIVYVKHEHFIDEGVVNVDYGDLCVYDISTGQETELTSGYIGNIALYGNAVTWDTAIGWSAEGPVYVCNFDDLTKPIANFTANVTTGTAPLVVLFTDMSTGGVPTSWNWDTGDGIYSKHAMNATHTFTKPGIYNVTLIVTNAAGNSSITKLGYITVTSPTAKPVADFYSPEAESVFNGTSDHGIYENETVSFFDNSTGSTSWLWDFGDGNTSTQKNPTHVYGKMGGYTVNLTVKNDIDSDTISKYGYVLVGIGNEPSSPAFFSSDVTSGSAPLTVTFLDDKDAESPNYPIWRQWNFGDGIIHSYMVDNNVSATPYATHTYEKPGKYTVTLYLDNRGGKSIITKYNYITVTDPVTYPQVLVAKFNCNVTKGYAPLAVQFNDQSQNAISRAWDFNNDGRPESVDAATVYVYNTPGIYTVKLTAINENGTTSKTGTITVLEVSSLNDDSNSNGGSSSGGSSSGGGGGSREPARNVASKEISQAYVTNDKAIKFDFTKNATCVVYVGFDSKKTAGKVTTIVEQLKGKSTLVSELPAGEVYKSFNVWVGNSGFATPKNIEKPIICFRVEKDWIKDKNIDSITLNRYDEKWEQIPVNVSGEDDKYMYFTANIPKYESFAITGTCKGAVTETGIANKNTTDNGINTTDKGIQTEQPMSGFGICYAIGILLFLRIRK